MNAVKALVAYALQTGLIEAGEETWTCENGHTGLTGNFCSECGAKKPE